MSAFAAPTVVPGYRRPCRRLNSFTPCVSAATARKTRASPPVSGDGDTVVVLMRHGLTDWNREGRVQGGLDKSRLNAVGTRQARVAGSCVRHITFDGVYVSPLSRARSTLEIVRQESANRSLLRARPETLSSLLEIQVPWQGLLKSDILQSYCGAAYMRYLSNPLRFEFNGFSPVMDLMRRARNTWNTLRRRRGRCLLVVGHNQMNRALLCDALGVRASLSLFRQMNCCFNVVVLGADGSMRIRLINSTSGGSPTMFYTARKGHVRFVLACEGGTRGLRTVLPKGEPRRRCRDVLLLDDASGVDLDDMGILERDTVPRRVRLEGNDDEIYQKCLNIVQWARTHSVDGTVVCIAKQGRLLSTLLTALIKMNGEGLDSFIFDAGGVTVCDVLGGSDMSSESKVYVECHNVHAFAKEMSPVFGYTLSQQAV